MRALLAAPLPAKARDVVMPVPSAILVPSPVSAVTVVRAPVRRAVRPVPLVRVRIVVTVMIVPAVLPGRVRPGRVRRVRGLIVTIGRVAPLDRVRRVGVPIVVTAMTVPAVPPGRVRPGRVRRVRGLIVTIGRVAPLDRVRRVRVPIVVTAMTVPAVPPGRVRRVRGLIVTIGRVAPPARVRRVRVPIVVTATTVPAVPPGRVRLVSVRIEAIVMIVRVVRVTTVGVRTTVVVAQVAPVARLASRRVAWNVPKRPRRCVLLRCVLLAVPVRRSKRSPRRRGSATNGWTTVRSATSPAPLRAAPRVRSLSNRSRNVRHGACASRPNWPRRSWTTSVSWRPRPASPGIRSG